MAVYVALLRGINVGGHNRLAMADLRALADRLKLNNPRTLLQSGNLLFESSGTTSAKLEESLENATKSQFGMAIDFVVRSNKEIRKAIAANPFTQIAVDDPSHLVSMFLKSAASDANVEVL